MLRRHLQQGGAPVTPCAGFDADTASAYIERALTATAHQRFETHLSNCAACRRHVVALARLSDELVTVPVAAPAPVPTVEPVWTRWRGITKQWAAQWPVTQWLVPQWLDISAWNFGWTAAGATACALLFAVLGVRVWQQQAPASQAPATLASRMPTEATLNNTVGDAASIVAEAPASADQTLVVNERTVVQAGAEAKTTAQAAAVASGNAVATRLQPPATPPPVLPVNPGLVALGRTPEPRVLAVDSNDATVTAPPVPPPAFNLQSSSVAFTQPAASVNSGFAMPVRLQNNAPVRSSAQLLLLGEPEKKEIVAELVLPEPRRAQLRDRAREEESANKAADDARKAASNRDLLKALKGHATSFMPAKPLDKNTEARTKEANVKEAQTQLQPLMKRLNGHVFYFDHGFWIDEQYTSDAKLPLKRLTRGSPEYQQLLIQNPSLEQFFKLAPVIVVWKGVVYEVQK